eukprot:573487-Pelagomonas_calceolata.AAC.6
MCGLICPRPPLLQCTFVPCVVKQVLSVCDLVHSARVVSVLPSQPPISGASAVAYSLAMTNPVVAHVICVSRCVSCGLQPRNDQSCCRTCHMWQQVCQPPTTASRVYVAAGASAVGYSLTTAIQDAFKGCTFRNQDADADGLLFDAGLLDCEKEEGENGTGYERVMRSLASQHIDTFFGAIALNSFRRNVALTPITAQALSLSADYLNMAALQLSWDQVQGCACTLQCWDLLGLGSSRTAAGVA